MNETIRTNFDTSLLPEWARTDPDVLELCKRDVVYRAGVIEYGKDHGWQKVFQSWARQWQRGY